MKECALPKTGGLARIGILDSDDLSDVLALQEVTRAALPDDRKTFFLPQGTAYFQNLLTRQNGLMIGIRAAVDPTQSDRGSLIAQMALMGPMDLREAIALRAITGNDVPFHHTSLDDSVVVFKSLVAHPDWRGNDLANALLSFAPDLPFTQVASHAFAQVSVGNRRSWDAFSRQGFGIVAAAYDAMDKQPRFIFQKPAFGFDFAPAIIADEADPVEDFSAIVNLTQREALVGVPDEEAAGKLAFMRSRDILNLMPTVAKIHAQVK